MPTSSSDATRPRSLAEPSVGSTIRDSIFSKVLFPAPLRPMIPTTSPWGTSNDTSLTAQNSSIDASLPLRLRNRRHGAVAAAVNASRKVVCRSILMSELIKLAKAFHDDGWPAAQATSAKRLSVRRK